MPIYEYVCMTCESHFEELVRGDQDPGCPDCGGGSVRRQLSLFSAKVEAPTPSFHPTMGGGGGCCGGGCGCH